MNVLDLFSGIGGFSLGLERAGMHTIGFSEIDPWCCAVLRKHWPHVPNYGDIRTVTGVAAQVVCAGFPCQDISVGHVHTPARGLAGARSGLWWEARRIVEEVRPDWFIAENVAVIRSRGLDTVLRSLDSIGYDAEWHCIPACWLGADHQRDRAWVIAYPQGQRVEGLRPARLEISRALAEPFLPLRGSDGQWEVEPDLRRAADGVPGWMDRLKCVGNAVVPQIPEIIGRAIMRAAA